MKLLFWIIALPLFFAGAFFAVANRDMIQVDLWPFWDRVPLPLYLALGAAFYVGFVFGGVVAWWAGRRARSRGRHEARRAERLARDNAALEARLAQAQATHAQSGQSRPLPARSA
jgi:uncharacterized integral membrane protein